MNNASLTRDCTFSEPTTLSVRKENKLTNWQREYKSSVTDIDELCRLLNLRPDQLPISLSSHKQFSLRVPKSYIQRMERSNPNDPLLLQILPSINEQQIVKGFTKDPVGDLQSVTSTGLLQKYDGRALLLATSRCAIHCRYCFRRHFPYSEQNPRYDAWQQALNELERNTSIHEVILSGGDPLVLSDSELKTLVKKIEAINHIKRLRIHTRLPVVIPNRVCDELLDWITHSRLKIIVVLHINHAQEINQEFTSKIQQLVKMQCTLLNQSVLLKNINDDSASLITLSEALFANNILPYYLHTLDKVEGAAHFEVSETHAQKLMREVAKRLPGYMVPKLAREMPGQDAKSLISY